MEKDDALSQVRQQSAEAKDEFLDADKAAREALKQRDYKAVSKAVAAESDAIKKQRTALEKQKDLIEKQKDAIAKQEDAIEHRLSEHPPASKRSR